MKERSLFIKAGRMLATVAIPTLLLCSSGCKKNNPVQEEATNETATKPDGPKKVMLAPNDAGFIKGADVSHVTRMEAEGKTFFNTTDQQDLFQIMKERGINTIRLRVWVNSTNSFAYNNTNDVVAKAVRAKNAGLKVFIDFHYSDTWADPWHQQKPAGWASMSLTALKNAINDHTTATLNALATAGVTPTFVEVGNEVDNGMLWPTGQIRIGPTNMTNFAELYKAGYTAVKAVNPAIKVMVHMSKGFNTDSCKYVLDGLVANGANFDVIGLSVYPWSGNYATIMSQTNANMQELLTTYGKEIIVAECGYDRADPAGARQLIKDLITNVSALPNGKGIGVCYWEPQYYDRPPTNKSIFDATTKAPTLGIDGFSMVSNPGFEEGTPSQTPLGWATAGTNPESNYTEATGHASANRLTHYKNGVYNVTTTQTITGLPNGNYTFQAWVASPYALTANYLLAKDFGGTQKTTNVAIAPGWQKVKVTGINVTNGQCTIGFYTSGNAKYCSFDNVQFFKE